MCNLLYTHTHSAYYQCNTPTSFAIVQTYFEHTSTLDFDLPSVMATCRYFCSAPVSDSSPEHLPNVQSSGMREMPAPSCQVDLSKRLASKYIKVIRVAFPSSLPTNPGRDPNRKCMKMGGHEETVPNLRSLQHRSIDSREDNAQCSETLKIKKLLGLWICPGIGQRLCSLS